MNLQPANKQEICSVAAHGCRCVLPSQKVIKLLPNTL